MYGLLNLIILLQHLQDKERDVRNVRAGAGELRMNLLRRSQICHLQLKSLERLLVEINLYWCNVPNVIIVTPHLAEKANEMTSINKDSKILLDRDLDR